MTFPTTVTNKHSKLTYKNQIVYVEYITDIYHYKQVSLECMSDFNRFIETLGINDISVLVFLTDYTKFSLEGREVLSSAEATKYVSNAAIVVSSGFQEFLGNLFLRISNPSVPVKLFKTELTAVEWLSKNKNVVLDSSLHQANV